MLLNCIKYNVIFDDLQWLVNGELQTSLNVVYEQGWFLLSCCTRFCVSEGQAGRDGSTESIMVFHRWRERYYPGYQVEELLSSKSPQHFKHFTDYYASTLLHFRGERCFLTQPYRTIFVEGMKALDTLKGLG
jgi:hypothetical protein